MDLFTVALQGRLDSLRPFAVSIGPEDFPTAITGLFTAIYSNASPARAALARRGGQGGVLEGLPLLQKNL